MSLLSPLKKSNKWSKHYHSWSSCSASTYFCCDWSLSCHSIPIPSYNPHNFFYAAGNILQHIFSTPGLPLHPSSNTLRHNNRPLLKSNTLTRQLYNNNQESHQWPLVKKSSFPWIDWYFPLATLSQDSLCPFRTVLLSISSKTQNR